MKKPKKDWRHIRRAIAFGLVRGAATTAGGLIITGIAWWAQQRS
ncbi:hypothetical protein [Streptomyces salinarius]|uniref:Uncharacterized protein n=1 Tax=Streptomyces salinarius TaxID=2762598 RepID=A0ABW8BLY6_9ACTN